MKKYLRDPTFSSWIFLGSKLTVLFVLTALIVKKFSVGEIALWYLFMSIQGFAHMFDIGFSATIIRYTAYSNAEEDKTIFLKKFQELYSSMNIVFLALTFFVIAFLLIIGYFSVQSIVGNNKIEGGMISFMIICIVFPINFFLKKNDAFIKGLNEVNLYNNWNAFIYFVTGCITITVIKLNQPFYIVVLANQVAIFFNSIKNAFLLSGVVPKGIRYFEFKYNKDIILNYWKPTWKSALISLSSNGATYMTNIMIPTIFSIEIVASYLFSMRMIQFVGEFSWAPFYSNIPVFIKQFKEGKLAILSHKVYSRLQISLLLLIVGLCLLGLLSSFVLSLLDSNTVFISNELLSLLLLMLFLERFIAMHSQVIMFSNNIEHYKYYLAILLGYLTFLGIFVKLEIGLFAIPFSYVIVSLIPMWFILNKSLSLLRVSIIDYFKKYFFIVSVLLIIALSILTINAL